MKTLTIDNERDANWITIVQNMRKKKNPKYKTDADIMKELMTEDEKKPVSKTPKKRTMVVRGSKGGPNSGNWGHSGRAGMHGGSSRGSRWNLRDLLKELERTRPGLGNKPAVSGRKPSSAGEGSTSSSLTPKDGEFSITFGGVQLKQSAFSPNEYIWLQTGVLSGLGKVTDVEHTAKKIGFKQIDWSEKKLPGTTITRTRNVFRNDEKVELYTIVDRGVGQVDLAIQIAIIFPKDQ